MNCLTHQHFSKKEIWISEIYSRKQTLNIAIVIWQH